MIPSRPACFIAWTCFDSKPTALAVSLPSHPHKLPADTTPFFEEAMSTAWMPGSDIVSLTATTKFRSLSSALATTLSNYRTKTRAMMRQKSNQVRRRYLRTRNSWKRRRRPRSISLWVPNELSEGSTATLLKRRRRDLSFRIVSFWHNPSGDTVVAIS